MAALTIRQFQSAFNPGQIDRANRIIRDVSIMQVGEVRGHECFSDEKTLQTVRDCAKAYKNGVKVRVDHGSGVMNIVGAIRGIKIAKDGVLRGDLHLFEHAEEADRLLELASEIPDTFGLSISFSGCDEKIKNQKFARCEEIFAVDLVPEPAANATGLFSTKTTNLNMDPKEEKKEEKDPIAELNAKVDNLMTSMDERMKKLENPEKKEDFEDEDADDSDYERLVKEHRALGIRIEAASKLRALSKPATSAPEVKKEPEVETKDFEALVKDSMEKEKLSKTQAITFCAKQYPKEHKEFLALGKTRVL